MKITVDQDKCCSAGMCVLNAPAVFDQSEYDGVVELLQDEPDEHLHNSVRAAADMCPAQAITLS